MRKKYVTFIISIIFGICLVITGISIWNKYFIRNDYKENPSEVTQEEKTKYSDEYGYCTVAYLNEKTNIDKKMGVSENSDYRHFRVKMIDYSISREAPIETDKMGDDEYFFIEKKEYDYLDENYTFKSDYKYVTAKFEIENTRENKGDDIINSFPFAESIYMISDNHISRGRAAECSARINSKGASCFNDNMCIIKPGQTETFTISFIVSDKYNSNKLAIRLCDKKSKIGDSYFMLFDEE